MEWCSLNLPQIRTPQPLLTTSGRNMHESNSLQTDVPHVTMLKIAPQVLMPRGIHAASFWLTA